MPADSMTCRHCGKSEFYSSEVSPGDGAALLPLGVLHGPKYRITVCGSCGLTEWFVPSRFLPLVKEQFEAVHQTDN